jgi:hypothetical protein
MHVKNRQCVQQHVVSSEAPSLRKRRRIRGEIAARQHRALRAARRAGGVQQGGERVGPCVERGKIRVRAGRRKLHQRTCAASVQRFHAAHTDGAGAFHRSWWYNRNARLRILEKVVEFGQRVSRVQRHEHRSQPQAGQVQRDGLGGFFDLCGDAIARNDAA